MKLGVILGASLLLAPAAFAQQNQNQANQPNTNQPGMNQPSANPPGMNQPSAKQAMPSSDTNQPATGDQSATFRKLLPTDAKLVGSVMSTEIRAFPDQVGATGEKAANLQKEDVVGVGGLDKMWTTKQTYKKTVSRFDQTLKGENIEPIAKTTTQSSTAYNVRMPDGHIANVVIRNTQPTTIESVSAAAVMGTMPKEKAQ